MGAEKVSDRARPENDTVGVEPCRRQDQQRGIEHQPDQPAQKGEDEGAVAAQPNVVCKISGIVAQRLLRRLCPTCKKPQEILPEIVARTGLQRLSNGDDTVFYGPAGCHNCNESGYTGQTAVIEVMTISDAIRRLILEHAEPREIQRVAVTEGMRTMYEDGLLKVLDGVTSLDEVLRVTRDV